MRIKAKDPRLVSLMGEFMRIYLPGVRNRDKDTIDSYRYSINLFVTYLESKQKVTVLTMQSSDFSQKNIVEFMAWLKSERNNVAPTINHRLSDLRGFCKYLYKKNAISLDAYEAIREISDVDDERILDFTWLSVNDVYLVLKSTDSNRETVRRLMSISTEKERNIGLHPYPRKYGASLKITAKNIIQTRLRRIWCFILSEMARKTKCPVIMSAVYL